MKLLILTHLDIDTIMALQAKHDVSIVVGATERNLACYLADCDVLIYRDQIPISAEILAMAPRLKLILRLHSDTDHVDLDAIAQRDIAFIRVPRPTARAVAEHTFGLMLGLARQIRCMDHRLRLGQIEPINLKGVTLAGKTLGIVGAGKIGRTTGELGRLWGMHVVGCVRQPTLEKGVLLREHGITLRPFDEVLSSADFLSVHVPYTNDNHHLISMPELALMKSSAFLLSMSDGGVVDEFALHEALVGRQIAGAALDAHETAAWRRLSPLSSLSNVILTPHIGGLTADMQRNIGRRVIQLIDEIGRERKDL